MKEELREFWEPPGPLSSGLFLRGWCARASGIRMLIQLTDTPTTDRRGLPAWF